MGVRTQATQHYPRYEATTLRYLDVQWGINQMRHCMIGISQQFLEPNAQSTELQKCMAASSDHSVETENAYYAIQYQGAPRLSSGYIRDARHCVKEWWKAIGAEGLHGETSVPICARKKVQADDLSSRVLALVEEKLGDVVKQVVQTMPSLTGRLSLAPQGKCLFQGRFLQLRPLMGRGSSTHLGR